MSTASVPNTFASAVTATGLQLDQNYNTIVAYLNEPLNRNNWATDSGNTNTIVLTFSPPVSAYSAGLEITFKAANTNSGAAVINANGLGNKNFLQPGGGALASGQIEANGIYKAAYNGSAFIYIGANVLAASQAQMETATSAVTFVAPSAQKFHPLHPKAWCVFDGMATGTTSVSIGAGIGTVIRVGTGSYQISFTSPYSSGNYAAFAFPGTATGVPGIQVTGRGTATCTLLAYSANAAVPMDITHIHFISFGDLP